MYPNHPNHANSLPNSVMPAQAGQLPMIPQSLVTKLTVEPTLDVIKRLTELLYYFNIGNAAIVSLVGAVDDCCISNMSLSNSRENIASTYEEPLELAGVGEVINGVPIIQCVFGREDGTALMGRMQSATSSSRGVNVYMLVAR